MERVSTDIPGLDALIEGGFPKGTNILVTGVPGTGKTIFGLGYLYNGALKGETGIYVTLDSRMELLREQGAQFGWDIAEMEKQNKIFFLKVPVDKMRVDLFGMINDVKRSINAKRLVFDSLATLAINFDIFSVPSPTPREANPYPVTSQRHSIYMIMEYLSVLGTTNLIITYSGEGGRVSLDGVSEYASDGIVRLFNELIGIKRVRTLSILKMRDTNHSQYIHDFEIDKNGITVKPSGTIYGMR